MALRESSPIESLREAVLAYGSAHPERVRLFQRDQVVIREGETSDLCYLIKSGTVGILVGDATTGTPVEVALRYARELIGETAFLQRGVARTATVVVRSDFAELVAIERSDLYSLLSLDPDLHEAIASLWELSASRRRELAAVIHGRVEVRTAMMTGVLADLHNFSGLGEVVWEEELDDFLFGFIEHCSDTVTAFDGRFEEQGDGFKAVFSAKDHAVRAVGFAATVSAFFRALRDGRAAENPSFKKLGLGVGVCTDFMSARKREGKTESRVLSHALNVAAAMSKYRESIDEVQVYVDPLTMKLASPSGVQFAGAESIALDKLGRRQTVHRLMAGGGIAAQPLAIAAESAFGGAGRVFVSYAHTDGVFVDRLVARLEADGVVVWRDNNEILVGDDVDRTISAGIQNNMLFLIVLTPSSLNSAWVSRELDEASHEASTGNKVLLPVVTGGLSSSHLPPRIRRRRFVEFGSDFEGPYALLLRSIRGHSRRGLQNQSQRPGIE